MFIENLTYATMASVPAVAVTTYEWERVTRDVEYVAKKEGMSFGKWDHVSGLVIDNSAQVEAIKLVKMLETLGSSQNTITVFLNFNPSLKNPLVMQKVRDLIQQNKLEKNLFVFISTSGEIPIELEKEIMLIEYDFPSKEELKEIVSLLGDYLEEEALAMADSAIGLTQNEAENYMALALSKNNLKINAETLNIIKKQKAQALKKSGVLELYEPENLPKVGGLDVLKLWLWEREKAFLPEARDFGLPFPKGILVFGIPGTGKSLIAKTIAKQWDMPLLVMGNILDKYVGESERKMKEALKQAEAMSPCVLMIDEIEKFFAGVGGNGDSGVSTRIFGQFLSWMQETTAPVFIVATANNIGILPPELLRKGRFDETFFVDLPSLKERGEIFNIHISRKDRNVENFDLVEIARATPGYTGSEIEQIVISALFRAFSRKQDITTETLIEIAKETPPLSITMAETISTMRKWGTERAKPASSSQEEPEKLLSSFSAKRVIKGQ